MADGHSTPTDASTEVWLSWSEWVWNFREFIVVCGSVNAYEGLSSDKLVTSIWKLPSVPSTVVY
jgi:hypothetical protein